MFPCDNSHPQSRWPNLDMVQAVRFLTVPHLQGRVKTVEPKGQNTGSKLSKLGRMARIVYSKDALVQKQCLFICDFILGKERQKNCSRL